jgi:hypothetical protein
MPDQQQPDKVKKRILLGITDFKSFEPQCNSIEQFLVADPNSHQGRIYGTYVTTHRISARTLAHVEKVCRPVFQREIGRGGEEGEGRGKPQISEMTQIFFGTEVFGPDGL